LVRTQERVRKRPIDGFAKTAEMCRLSLKARESRMDAQEKYDQGSIVSDQIYNNYFDDTQLRTGPDHAAVKTRRKAKNCK
jgi:cbb3-type cytochrome oxidase cytochrome c subunit